MDDDDKRRPKRPSPRERAQTHLTRMLQVASFAALAACGDDGTMNDDGVDCCDPLPPPSTGEVTGDEMTATTDEENTTTTTTTDTDGDTTGTDEDTSGTDTDATSTGATTGDTTTGGSSGNTTGPG